MRLNLGKREYLIVVEKSDDDISLVTIMSEYIESHRVKCKSHRSGNVLRMVADELKKLLDIRWTILVQWSVIDVNDDLLKIVLFLLPL